MKKICLKILSDEERQSCITRLHKLRVKRLIVGSVIVLIGTMLPEFSPHLLSVITSDTVKGIGYVPLLKIVEDLFLT